MEVSGEKKHPQSANHLKIGSKLMKKMYLIYKTGFALDFCLLFAFLQWEAWSFP